MAIQKPRIEAEQSWTPKAAKEQTQSIAASPLFRDFPEEAPHGGEYHDIPQTAMEEPQRDESSGGLTTLLSRYFTGETSGSARGVVYH